MRAATELPTSELQRLAASFVGARAGAAEVQEAAAEVRYDEEEPYVLVSLALGPPPRGEETWTTEDMFQLRQEVRRRLAAAELDHVELSYVGGGTEGDSDEGPPSEGKIAGTSGDQQ